MNLHFKPFIFWLFLWHYVFLSVYPLNTKASCEQNFMQSKYTKFKTKIEAWYLAIQKKVQIPPKNIYIMGEVNFNRQNEEGVFINKTPDIYILNPSYYNQLTNALTPVFHPRSKGIIITTSLKEAEVLQKLLQEQFKQTQFEVYHFLQSENINQKVLDNSKTKNSHFIIAREWPSNLKLPHLSNYINLNSNIPADRVLEESQRVFKYFPDKKPGYIFFLVHYQPSRVEAVNLLGLIDVLQEGIIPLKKVQNNRLTREISVQNNSSLRTAILNFINP